MNYYGKEKYTYVFNNFELVNRLISEGYPLLRIRPNFKNANQLVFCFNYEAEETKQRLLVDMGYKPENYN